MVDDIEPKGRYSRVRDDTLGYKVRVELENTEWVSSDLEIDVVILRFLT